MQRSNIDSIPIMVAPGEMVISNEAADKLGRTKLANANRQAATSRNQPMQQTTAKAALPRLGKPLDMGNQVMGNTQIPGVNRTGNNFSQAPGFQPSVMPPPAPQQQPMIGYSLPAQQVPQQMMPALPGYATGTQDEEGVQPHLTQLTQTQQPYELGNGAMDVQGLPTNTLNIDDGQGGFGKVQFADNRALSLPQQTELTGQINYNALPETRAKYDANAANYKAEEAQKAEQARIDGLTNMALTSPNASTQGIGAFLNTKSNQQAALHALPTVSGAQQNQAHLNETIRTNKANTEAGIAKAGYEAQQDQNKFQLEQNKAMPNVQRAFMIEALQKSLAAGKGNSPEYKALEALYQKMIFGNKPQDDSLTAYLNQPQ